MHNLLTVDVKFIYLLRPFLSMRVLAYQEHYELFLLCSRPKFRSYKPQDEQLKESVMPNAKPADVEEEVKEQLEAADSRVVMDDLVSLFP